MNHFFSGGRNGGDRGMQFQVAASSLWYWGGITFSARGWFDDVFFSYKKCWRANSFFFRTPPRNPQNHNCTGSVIILVIKKKLASFFCVFSSLPIAYVWVFHQPTPWVKSTNSPDFWCIPKNILQGSGSDFGLSVRSKDRPLARGTRSDMTSSTFVFVSTWRLLFPLGIYMSVTATAGVVIIYCTTKWVVDHEDGSHRSMIFLFTCILFMIKHHLSIVTCKSSLQKNQPSWFMAQSNCCSYPSPKHLQIQVLGLHHCWALVRFRWVSKLGTYVSMTTWWVGIVEAKISGEGRFVVMYCSI